MALHVPQIRNRESTEPLKCDIWVSDKKIVLRNDHGMDVLEAFSRRLIRSRYVVGVVNSLPYNPYERRFIKCELPEKSDAQCRHDRMKNRRKP